MMPPDEFAKMRTGSDREERMKALPGKGDIRTAVVDPTVLAELQQLDESGELLETLIAHFIQDTPKLLATLRIALSQGDSLALAEAAHTLKGSSSNLGATRMQQLCAELQAHGRGTNSDHVGERLALLHAEFAAVQTILLKAKDRAPYIKASASAT